MQFQHGEMLFTNVFEVNYISIIRAAPGATLARMRGRPGRRCKWQRSGPARPAATMDKTFLKGLALLEALARSEQPRGVTELAGQLALTKSNVHRLLQALIECGYARQESDRGQYACTLKLWELGLPISERVSVKAVASPYMQALARDTGETVHLSVLDGADVVYVDKIDSPQPVRAYTRIGGRAPAYAVATGKALLAWLPAAEFDALDLRIRAHTARTVADIGALRGSLPRIRADGYAINRGEWRESVCGAACPIFEGQSGAVAAIGISGPAERLPPRVLRSYAVLLRQAAEAISRALGYRGS